MTSAPSHFGFYSPNYSWLSNNSPISEWYQALVYFCLKQGMSKTGYV